MDSQQNFPLNSAPDQKQPNPPSNANNMGPTPFPPASFGTPATFAASPTDQFPKSVNEAFNIPAQPASFNQPSQPTPAAPMGQPFAPAASTPVPPPPSSAPDIGIRTMASDAESLQATGGAEAAPQVFAAAPAGPNEPVFTPDVVNLSASKPGMPKKSNTLLIAVVIGLAAILGLLLLFKYVLLPKMCPVQVCEPCPAPTATETQPIAPAPEEAVEVAPTRVHASYFTIPADQIENIQLATVDLTNIKEALSKIPVEKIKPSTVVEAVLADDDGPITLPIYVNAILPGDIPESDLSANFEDDFTQFVYYDSSSNPFPGFVAKVKSGVGATSYNAIGTKFEASKQLANIFLTDTGNFGKFDNGSIDSTKIVRFSRGSNSQRIEYGFFKSGDTTYWVVATSYNAIKEAAKRLGI
ncbi:MAG: hypothetical protein M1586_02775 [Patescibacteria group bacterium]|nr:hypothetical protein [Patescibacteria group bacterium]MCL5262194.1 hypothetical protein [Patescibacteria group bacterium]